MGVNVAKYRVNWRLEHNGETFVEGDTLTAKPEDVAHLEGNVLTLEDEAAPKGRKGKAGSADEGGDDGKTGDAGEGSGEG
jgi:hypothetical protein